MPTLPKRPGPYITAFLIIILVILTVWLDHALNSPALHKAVRKHKHAASPVSQDPP